MAKRVNGFDMYYQFSDWLNGATEAEKRQFVNAALVDHRELQNDLFYLFLGCVQGWAQAGRVGNFDARNVHAVQASTVIAQTLKL